MKATDTHIRVDQLASREYLGRTFQNRMRLSEGHFALVIHSTLNKRDDQFHGYWRVGHTYQPGDVVYYEDVLWEMTAEQAICGSDDNKPGVGKDWTSKVQGLSDRVDTLEQKLNQLTQEFTDYKQQMEKRWQRTEFQLTVLTVALGTLCLGWLLSYFYHLWVGVG